MGLSIADVFDRKDISWMDGTGPDSDIVISSRVRLARNLYKFPFPHLLDDTTGPQVMQLISQSVSKSGDKVIKGLELVTLDALSTLDRNILMEKHLLSPEHAASSAPYQGLIVDKDGSLAIMINEEDHLRIQCLLSGLQLNQAYKYAQTVDDALEKLLDYAFSEKLGYLTACPTNVGTGMRASVMLHLPAMALTNQISSVVQSITQVGLTVRGMYGEGTEAAGNLYQLSNQVTLGQTEEDIINNLWVITVQLATQERNLRERLQKEIKYQIEDKVMRSYGLLTNARLLTSAEALSLLSDVRMGIEMGILSPVKREVLNQLIVAINPSHVQKAAGRELEPRERDIKRAEIIKEKLLAS